MRDPCSGQAQQSHPQCQSICSAPSLGQLVARFLQERQWELAPTSRRTYRIALEQFAKTCPVPLEQVQPLHIQSFLNGLKGRPFQGRSGQWVHPPASPATYNLKRLALRQFFEWAIQQGYFSDPLPTQAIRPARMPPRLPRDLDRLLLQRVLQRAQNHSLRYAALIRLLLECGLRARELLDLTIQDFQTSPEGSLLEVRCGKGGKPRAVAVGDPLSELLQQYLSLERGPYAPTDPLFVSRSRCPDYRDRPLTYDGLRHIVLKLTEPEPGHQTPVQFRHSFATLLLERGVAPEHIQHLLGHSSPTMTMRYTQRANLKSAISYSRSVLNQGLV